MHDAIEQASRRWRGGRRGDSGRTRRKFDPHRYSLSTDPSKKGAPSGHTVNVREVRAAVGAGFLYLLCGDIMTVLRCVEITLQAPRHRRDVSLLDFYTGAGAAYQAGLRGY